MMMMMMTMMAKTTTTVFSIDAETYFITYLFCLLCKSFHHCSTFIRLCTVHSVVQNLKNFPLAQRVYLCITCNSQNKHSPPPHKRNQHFFGGWDFSGIPGVGGWSLVAHRAWEAEVYRQTLLGKRKFSGTPALGGWGFLHTVAGRLIFTGKLGLGVWNLLAHPTWDDEFCLQRLGREIDICREAVWCIKTGNTNKQAIQ